MTALGLASCRTHTEVVEVPKVSIDTVIIQQYKRDSIWLHDSVFQQQKGDTIFISQFHTKYKYITQVDTFYQSRVDTVTNVVEVPKPVKYTPRLVKLLASLGGLVLAGGFGYAAIKIYTLFI